MRQDKNRHIFNARSRRKPVAENARPSKKKNDQRDDATVLPAAINDNERLTPRQRGHVRDHNKIVDEASGRTVEPSGCCRSSRANIGSSRDANR